MLQGYYLEESLTEILFHEVHGRYQQIYISIYQEGLISQMGDEICRANFFISSKNDQSQAL